MNNYTITVERDYKTVQYITQHTIHIIGDLDDQSLGNWSATDFKKRMQSLFVSVTDYNLIVCLYNNKFNIKFIIIN